MRIHLQNWQGGIGNVSEIEFAQSGPQFPVSKLSKTIGEHLRKRRSKLDFTTAARDRSAAGELEEWAKAVGWERRRAGIIQGTGES